MKHHSLFAALLILPFTPALAQEEAPAAGVAAAEEALEKAAGGEALEVPEEQAQATAEAAQAPEQRAQDAPLQFTYEAFMEADQDGNGILSIEEANAALASVTFEDANGDGWLNHAEVEAAVAGADIAIEGAGTHSVVGESDFIRILRTVQDNREATQVAQQG